MIMTIIFSVLTVFVAGLFAAALWEKEWGLTALFFYGYFVMFSCTYVLYMENVAPQFHDVPVAINGHVMHVQYVDDWHYKVPEDRIQFLVSLWSERLEDPVLGAYQVAENLQKDHGINAWIYGHRID